MLYEPYPDPKWEFRAFCVFGACFVLRAMFAQMCEFIANGIFFCFVLYLFVVFKHEHVRIVTHWSYRTTIEIKTTAKKKKTFTFRRRDDQTAKTTSFRCCEADFADFRFSLFCSFGCFICLVFLVLVTCHRLNSIQHKSKYKYPLRFFCT